MKTFRTFASVWCAVGVMAAASAAHAQSCFGDWEPASSAGPSPRNQAALAFDSDRGRVVLFGGGPAGGQQTDETWEWDGSAWTQLNPGTRPPARAAHAMVYDSVRHVTVLFGGVDPAIGHFDDTWEWDGANWMEKSPATRPASRRSHAMAFDAERGVVVMHGGIGANFPIKDDTWEWNGADWTLLATGTPSARVKAAMAYDSIRHVTVLFGGQLDGSGTANGDTWEWDGATWTLRTSTGPTPRWAPALAFDPVRRMCVLFGGSTNGNPGSPLGDTWTWDGLEWSEAASSGPTPRYYHSIGYDPARERAVLFGGFDGTVDLGDTWEFVPGAGPSIDVDPESQTFDVGDLITLTVSASGPPPITYQWRKNGTNVLNGGRVSGAKTSTLSIVNAEPSDNGDYDVAVTASGCTGFSSTAMVLVLCPSDLNGDGYVTGVDFDLYVQAFQSGDINSDFDGDGFVTGVDFDQYVQAFEKGC